MAKTTEHRGAEPAAPGEVHVRRALFTVSDKRGLVDFGRGLLELGVELVSTGGTARELGMEGVETRSVEDYTGFPEILDGRVKTLNPRIYAGLLAVRENPKHVDTLNEHGIEPIDLVCVNLYPFERTAARRGVSDEEVIENIDIGGPTLIRAAAKNHAFAAVVSRPESYDAVLEELRMTDGRLSEQTREALAMEAFSYTARYDAAIAQWFAEREDDFPAIYPRVSSTSPTARTPTSGPLTTRRPAPARTCSRWSPSSTARSSRSTTCSISTRDAGWSRSSRCRPRPS